MAVRLEVVLVLYGRAKKSFFFWALVKENWAGLLFDSISLNILFQDGIT